MTITNADREAARNVILQAAMDIDSATPAPDDDDWLAAHFARHRIAAVEADRRGRTFSPTELDEARREALEEAAKVAFDRLHPHPNHPEMDWTRFAKGRAIAAMLARDAIRAMIGETK